MLGVIDTVVVMNAVLALIACAVNISGAVVTKGWLRAQFLCVASFALFYSAAYMWLWAYPDRALEWSNVLRPFSIIVWPIAWTAPAWFIIRYLRDEADRLSEQTLEILDEWLEEHTP